MEDGPGTKATAIHMGDQDGVHGPWLHPAPTSTIVAIWTVNTRSMGDALSATLLFN